MNAARILPVLVTLHADLVACTPYRAKFTARVCLRNQATASSAEASSDQRLSLGRCGGCEIGLRVASDLRNVVDPRGAVTAAKGQRYGRKGP